MPQWLLNIVSFFGGGHAGVLAGRLVAPGCRWFQVNGVQCKALHLTHFAFVWRSTPGLLLNGAWPSTDCHVLQPCIAPLDKLLQVLQNCSEGGALSWSIVVTGTWMPVAPMPIVVPIIGVFQTISKIIFQSPNILAQLLAGRAFIIHLVITVGRS